jgi:uncharacterized membrane protein
MRIVRILALLGFGISAYLFSMKLSGEISSVVGCGGEGGCSDVLGSEWSQWFGIPVSAVSAAFYLVILTLTVKPFKSLLTMAAFLLIGAAAWFMGLQAFVIKSFCPWCFGTHVVGLLTAGAILWKARAKLKPALIAVPLVLIIGLALGQIFGPKPDTHEVTTESGFGERKEIEEQMMGAGRVISFSRPDGIVVKTYRLGSVPFLGPPDAKHFLVKYFDYTCSSCLEMEGDLAALFKKYPKDVGVILMPTPLNRACNPYLPAGLKDHEHACELARLGLAAWRAQPESFAKANEVLFERPIHDPASAKAELETIIPAEKLEAALKDPWIEKALKANLEDYRKLSSRDIKMPKLLIKGERTLHGLARSTEQFVEIIKKELELP